MTLFAGLSPGIRRAGFLLPLVVVVVTIGILLGMAYNSFARNEARRVHRTYWNDLLTKVAEGVGEEAYAWFIANPDNDIVRFFTAPDTADDQ